MVAWSVVSLLTYKAHDYHTMLVCRLVLGIVESPVSDHEQHSVTRRRLGLTSVIIQFYPGALYMLSMFYTRKEIAARISIFYTATMAASAFAGLINAPIFTHLGGVRGLSGWQW